MYKVVVVEPRKAPYVKEIGEELRDLQEVVGGLIELVRAMKNEKLCLICNEEGKNNGMEYNRPLFDKNGNVYDIVAGTFFVVALHGDNFRSLTDDEVEEAMEAFEDLYCFQLR